MKTLLTLLLTVPHILNTLAFNLATDYYLVYSNPKDDNNLFGLSVILRGERNENKSWVQIGAPARITSRFEHSVVYRCNIGKKCLPLNFGKSEFQGDGWLGSAMDINEASNITVVCEPLAKKKYKDKNLVGDLFVIGSCYMIDFSGTVTEVLKPLDRPDKMYYTPEKLPYFYGVGEFGFSVRFTDDCKDSVILFGAPGVLNWIGYPLKHEKGETAVGDRNDFIYSKRDVLKSYSYIGYSTVAGRFNKDCNVCFAYGAPKSADAKGTVLILDNAFQQKQLLTGHQIGEYFGGALAAGDINADGYDDLIVGSPSYSTSSYSEGCIHLFLGTIQKLFGNQYICGSKPGAHFGTSISYLFDLDWDGYGDIAVGAPYEDDSRGVVYIYNGSPTGLIRKPSQKISGRSVYDSLRGFGYSISNPADIDTNHYNDIAIGAYKSGHVVIIQSKPIVTIHQSLKPVTTLNAISQFVEVLACFKYEAKNYNKSIKINISLSVEPTHISVEKDLPKNLLIQNHQQRCENITLKVNKNKHTNIHLKLNSTLINRTPSAPIVILATNESNNYRSSFCNDCVLSNRTHSTVLDLYIPFSLHCRNTTVCFANYYTKSSFLHIRKNTIIVGTRNSISLKVDAINDGENAYLATIDIELPHYVQFGMIPTICELHDNKLSCSIDDPLPNTTKTVFSNLDLDLERINKGIFVDNIEVKLTAQTESKNLAKNVEILPLRLMYAGAISLTKQVFNNMEVRYKEDTNTAVYSDIYKVENLGPSPAAALTIKFLIPTAINEDKNIFLNSTPLIDFTDNSNLRCTVESAYKTRTKQEVEYVEINRPYELNLANLTIELNCSQENVLCQEIVCTTGSLIENDFLIVPLQMNFSSNALADIFGDKTILAIAVDASVSVKEPKLYMPLGNKFAIRTYNVIIKETKKKFIETWIIISSMIVGFMLLVVLTVALWKVGFFERTKRKQLQLEKKILTTGEFYSCSGALSSVERDFINPNVLLRSEDDD